MSPAVSIFLLLISRSGACASCPCVILPGEDLNRPATLVPRAKREAESIFAGLVTRVDTASTGERWFPSDTASNRRLLRWAESVRYTFRVDSAWKGAPERETIVTVSSAHSSCGRVFESGEQYLVYTERGGEASSCARVKLLGDAKADLEVLGPGRAPR
jgi:hypothetical protein